MKKCFISILFVMAFLIENPLSAKVLLPSEKKALEKQAQQIQLERSQKDSPYEKEIDVVQPECLEWVGGGNEGLGKQFLQFYNQCPYSVRANVCVEEYPGKFRLHRSATRIPQFGRLTLFTYEGTRPGSVTWFSSRGAPNVPGACSL